MKKCGYCAKEISYHEMYCCDECQNSVNRFYELREKYQKVFSAVNGIFVLLIGISIFFYALFQNLGVFGVMISLFVLGILYFFLPFPPEVMIQKYKLKKSIKICRFIALGIFLLGVVVLILYLTKVV